MAAVSLLIKYDVLEVTEDVTLPPLSSINFLSSSLFLNDLIFPVITKILLFKNVFCFNVSLSTIFFSFIKLSKIISASV